MWMKWFPWRFIVRNVARRRGFLDPIALLATLQRFAQPSEVAAPTELLRSGAVLHARGLMNSQAIQHNLDWIWPFWVERQFNPLDDAFVPRAFSITHINLTHRNWTAVGMADTEQWPIIDPRGLVTPLYDGWSIDAWIISENGLSLFPSRLGDVRQSISTSGNLNVTTVMSHEGQTLISQADVVGEANAPVCRITLKAVSDHQVRLAVALRPYNPEGVSFIHDVAWLQEELEWKVNDHARVILGEAPEQIAFSDYRKGDVFSHLPLAGEKYTEFTKGGRSQKVHCDVGMATTVALFPLSAHKEKNLTVYIPLTPNQNNKPFVKTPDEPNRKWEEIMEDRCRLNVPDEWFQFLYDNAIRTLVLHSPGDVYPGPYTYKRFWFRDAAFILNAMLCVGFKKRVERVLNRFPSRQKQLGYFLSQEGEWDSNGEAIWILQRYCELTGQKPLAGWKDAIYRGGQWISRKRLSEDIETAHAGLLPAGFSAEHLGPNDYYYWDDFWGVAGLNAAGLLAAAYEDTTRAEIFTGEAKKFSVCIQKSLMAVEERMKQPVIPASPYRRLDSGAIGSLVADYPLRLLPAGDERIMSTVEFLLKNCLVNGGFFQDMTHSGVNPYLTLHMAQVLLRAGDMRYIDLMRTTADLATPTGQWPEAIHPRTKGGCMGDGQHVWAAAEWVMLVKNCFVREEEGGLVLCAGLISSWFDHGDQLSIGPVATPYGPISLSIINGDDGVEVQWQAQWFDTEPRLEICLPHCEPVRVKQGQTWARLQRRTS